MVVTEADVCEVYSDTATDSCLSYGDCHLDCVVMEGALAGVCYEDPYANVSCYCYFPC